MARTRVRLKKPPDVKLAPRDTDRKDPVARATANVFVMDWRDHPAKTQEWYNERRARAEADGVLHLFAQEVDRDYAASVEGIIIRPEWVKAAIDADKALGLEISGPVTSGLDVADGGRDTNAQTIRRGIKAMFLDEWGARDTGVTARRSIDNVRPYANEHDVNFQYDSLGVGAGVKAEINRLSDEKLVPKNIYVHPWAGSDAVLDPFGNIVPNDSKSRRNRDFFQNLKAQGWWQVARMFERTFRAIHDPTFTKWIADDLIVVPSTLKYLAKLMKELSQPTMTQSSTMKLMINKTPEGTKSPNLGDSFVMCYWPWRPAGGVVFGPGVVPVGHQRGDKPRRT